MDPENPSGKRQREQWGCETDLPFAAVQMDGEGLTRCPRRPYLEDPEFFHEVYEAFRWYERGHLPSPGGWTEQSPALLRYIDIIEQARSDAQEAREKKAARAPGKAGSSAPVPRVPQPRGSRR